MTSALTSQATAAGNQFANRPFAGTEKANQQMKDTVMRMKTAVISGIIAVTKSRWMRPALMTLTLLTAVAV
jgi:hypothetical protein